MNEIKWHYIYQDSFKCLRERIMKESLDLENRLFQLYISFLDLFLLYIVVLYIFVIYYY